MNMENKIKELFEKCEDLYNLNNKLKNRISMLEKKVLTLQGGEEQPATDKKTPTLEVSTPLRTVLFDGVEVVERWKLPDVKQPLTHGKGVFFCPFQCTGKNGYPERSWSSEKGFLGHNCPNSPSAIQAKKEAAAAKRKATMEAKKNNLATTSTHF